MRQIYQGFLKNVKINNVCQSFSEFEKNSKIWLIIWVFLKNEILKTIFSKKNKIPVFISLPWFQFFNFLLLIIQNNDCVLFNKIRSSKLGKQNLSAISAQIVRGPAWPGGAVARQGAPRQLCSWPEIGSRCLQQRHHTTASSFFVEWETHRGAKEPAISNCTYNHSRTFEWYTAKYSW